VRVQRARAVADISPMDRRVVWLFVGAGMTAGGFLPVIWGGSALGFSSLVFGTLGGIAGLWFGLQLTG
jgi:hypothetical protein